MSPTLAELGQALFLAITPLAILLHITDTSRHRPARPPLALTPEQRDHLRNWAE